MTNGIGVFQVILLLGTIQGFILTLSLLGRKRDNVAANKFLALFLLLISLTMLGRLLLETSLIKFFPNFLALPDAIIFLYGPLMYLYLRKLLVDSSLSKIKIASYFIPAILFLLSEIPPLLKEDHYLRILWVKHTTIRYILIEGAAILHNIYFFILQCRLFIKYKNASNNNFSYKQYPSFRLLYLLIGFTLFVWLLSYYSWVFGYNNILSDIGYSIIWISLPFIAYTMGYFAMRNSEFFKINLQKNNAYKNTIPEEEKHQILEKTITTMERNKLYKNPEFSLTFLADNLSIDRNKLSQLINSEFKKKFNDWTNDYRIVDSKSLLLESSLRINEIYYDVGFSSKSAFNNAFKKKVGMTPSEFRQKNKIN